MSRQRECQCMFDAPVEGCSDRKKGARSWEAGFTDATEQHERSTRPHSLYLVFMLFNLSRRSQDRPH